MNNLIFLEIRIPDKPAKTPRIQPMITSKGKCAPTPTLVKTKMRPTITTNAYQKILLINSNGIKEKSKTVRIAKTVIECPEGKLLCPVNVLPIITKEFWLKAATGLGTEKRFFKGLDSRSLTKPTI